MLCLFGLSYLLRFVYNDIINYKYGIVVAIFVEDFMYFFEGLSLLLLFILHRISFLS